MSFLTQDVENQKFVYKIDPTYVEIAKGIDKDLAEHEAKQKADNQHPPSNEAYFPVEFRTIPFE